MPVVQVSIEQDDLAVVLWSIQYIRLVYLLAYQWFYLVACTCTILRVKRVRVLKSHSWFAADMGHIELIIKNLCKISASTWWNYWVKKKTLFHVALRLYRKANFFWMDREYPDSKTMKLFLGNALCFQKHNDTVQNNQVLFYNIYLL